MAQLAMDKRTGQGSGLSGLSRLFGLFGFIGLGNEKDKTAAHGRCDLNFGSSPNRVGKKWLKSV